MEHTEAARLREAAERLTQANETLIAVNESMERQIAHQAAMIKAYADLRDAADRFTLAADPTSVALAQEANQAMLEVAWFYSEFERLCSTQMSEQEMRDLVGGMHTALGMIEVVLRQIEALETRMPAMARLAARVREDVIYHEGRLVVALEQIDPDGFWREYAASA